MQELISNCKLAKREELFVHLRFVCTLAVSHIHVQLQQRFCCHAFETHYESNTACYVHCTAATSTRVLHSLSWRGLFGTSQCRDRPPRSAARSTTRPQPAPGSPRRPRRRRSPPLCSSCGFETFSLQNIVFTPDRTVVLMQLLSLR